jgi:hypothetical protein
LIKEKNVDEEKAPVEDPGRSWAEIIIILILTQMFWWFMFANPMLKLLERLCAGIDRICPM